MSNSVILERDRQARWAEREEQGAQARRRSQWVICTLSDYLPPEHVTLAQRLAYLQGMIEGCRMVNDRVDYGGNSIDAQMARRLDAMRAFAGLEAAALNRVGSDGRACMRAIAEGEHATDTARRCGIPPDSRGRLVRLVQMTLIALFEYEEENAKQKSKSAA